MNVKQHRYELITYQITNNPILSDKILTVMTDELCNIPFKYSLIERDRKLLSLLGKLTLAYSIATCSYNSLYRFIKHTDLVVKTMSSLILGELKFNKRYELSNSIDTLINSIINITSIDDTELRNNKLAIFISKLIIDFDKTNFENCIDYFYLEFCHAS